MALPYYINALSVTPAVAPAVTALSHLLLHFVVLYLPYFMRFVLLYAKGIDDGNGGA